MLTDIRVFGARVVALTLCLAGAASAQTSTPPRPKLAPGVDTNDATAYLAAARREIGGDAKYANAAYTWALRLDPSSADAQYGRSVTMVLDDGDLVRIMLRGPKNRAEANRARQADSLRSLAELLDPFLDRRLDRYLVERLMKAGSGYREVDVEASRDYERGRGPSDYQQGLSEWIRGYSGSALKWFGSALDKARDKAPLYALRGRIFQNLGQSDSAVISLRLALKEFRNSEDTTIVRFYQPKARYLYQIGWALETMSKTAEAKEAYGQALIEDLSFWPAHQRIALIALGGGDTTTALAEFDLATQVGGHDAILRVQYAYALAGTRHLAEASDQVQRVIAEHPDYADPYLMLARLYDATDMADLALVNYRQFLDRAPTLDTQREFAQGRVSALGATVAKSPEKP